MSGRDSFPADGMLGNFKQDEFPPLSTTTGSEELLAGRHLQVQCTVIPTGKNNDDTSPTLSTVRLEVPLAPSVHIKPSTDHALYVPKRRMSNKWTQQSELQKNIEHKSSNVGSGLTISNEDSHDQRVASEYQAYTVRIPPPGECTRSMSLTGYNPTVLSEYKLMKDVEDKDQGLVKCIPEKRERLQVYGHKKTTDITPSGAGEEEVTGYLLPSMEELFSWKNIKLIGRGNFSDVYVYESSDDSLPPIYRTVAVKSIRYPSELIKSNSRNTPKGSEMLSRLESSLTRELIILQTLDHPCIVKLYGINDREFLTGKRPLMDRIGEGPLPPCNMIMSYCSGGDLLELAKTHKLPDWLLQRIIVELSQAVKYLHDNHVIHRDIKLENVLIKYSWEQLILKENCYGNSVIELADFGLCRQVQAGELCNARCGSEDYVAPEILMGLSYDGRLCDTWAIGVLLYALLEDRLPFDLIPSHIHRRGRTRSIAHRIARLEWRWLVLASSEHPAKEIVNHCLVSRQNRWNIDDIIGSAYVSDLASKLSYLPASPSGASKTV